MKRGPTKGPRGANLESRYEQTLSTTSGPELQTTPSSDLADVRDIYWRFVRLGHRLPAQRGVIVLRGRAKT